MRKDLIKQIVGEYTNKYTCAQMCERFSQQLQEEREANDYLKQKRKELTITAEEINEALEELADEARKAGTAMFYDFYAVK